MPISLMALTAAMIGRLYTFGSPIPAIRHSLLGRLSTRTRIRSIGILSMISAHMGYRQVLCHKLLMGKISKLIDAHLV